MRVATYARVSTGRQEKEETIKSQTMANMDKIATENHELIVEYKDEGWSGTILARPGLDQLRIDAKTNKWDAVIIYDPDRLSRKNVHMQMLVDELERLGKQVLFVTTGPIRDDNDRLMFGVKGLFAEYERVKIAERLRLGKLRKARDGHVITSTAPYGYKYLRRGSGSEGRYEIFPEEARIVKSMFEWVADEGLTIRKIVKRLDEMGVKPRKSKRGVWNTSTLSTLFRNETYIGKAHYLKSEGIEPKNPIKNRKYKRIIKTSRRMRSRDEWITIEVPSIIEESLFWRVARQLKTNYAVCRRNRKNDYLMAGKIYCACGCRRNGEGTAKNNHLYYRCSDRVRSFPRPRTCKEGGVNAVVADSLVWKGISDFMSDAELLKKQLKRYVSDHNQKQVLLPTSRDQIKNELVSVDKKEKRYLDLYGDEQVTREVLDTYLLELKQKKYSLEQELLNMPKISSWVMPKDADLDIFAKMAQEKMNGLSFEAKRGILLKLVDKVVVDQSSLTVTGCLPLDQQFSGYLNHGNVVYGSISRDRGITKCGEEYVV